MAVTGLIVRRLRDRAHGGQPAGVRRAAQDQRVRGGCCTSLGASCSWLARVVLLVALVLHVLDGVPAHAHERSGARPIGYADARAAGLDARVAHDALGRRAAARLHRLPHPALHDRHRRSRREPARRAVSGVQPHRRLRQRRRARSGSGGSSLFYVVAMLFLVLHLFHGAWSSVRTLGLTQAVAQSAAAARRRRCSPSSSGSASPSIPLAVLARSDPIDDASN